MERKITNIDEFQMDENETPILPTGLREEENLYVLPDGRYLPCALETLKRTRASVLNQGARPLPAYYLIREQRRRGTDETNETVPTPERAQGGTAQAATFHQSYEMDLMLTGSDQEATDIRHGAIMRRPPREGYRQWQRGAGRRGLPSSRRCSRIFRALHCRFQSMQARAHAQAHSGLPSRTYPNSASHR